MTGMTKNLSDTQWAALLYYCQSEPRPGRCPAVSTTRSLHRLGLIEDVQASPQLKMSLGRRVVDPFRITILTGAGFTVVGNGGQL